MPPLHSTRISSARGLGYALCAFHGRVLHLILDLRRTWVGERRTVDELMRKAKFSESLKADQVCRSASATYLPVIFLGPQVHELYSFQEALNSISLALQDGVHVSCSSHSFSEGILQSYGDLLNPTAGDVTKVIFGFIAYLNILYKTLAKSSKDTEVFCL